jgi:hypothetical protein
MQSCMNSKLDQILAVQQQGQQQICELSRELRQSRSDNLVMQEKLELLTENVESFGQVGTPS